MDREFLERWSREWVVAHDPQHDRPLAAEVRAGWLGFGPASESEIEVAERRLDRRLPPSLRTFLLITDGWRNAGNFVYRLAGAAELVWMRDTDDAHWAQAYEDEVIERSLRLSLAGDSTVLFLDPLDVNENGEWAAYHLASWSGRPPDRFDSFDDLMFDLYAGFHALRKPPGDTRDRWDAEVELARIAALGGEIDGPAEVFAEAIRFGRDRARLLYFQLCAMRCDWHTAALNYVFLCYPGVYDDPLFEAELLPLLFVEDSLTHRRELFTLNLLQRIGNRRPPQSAMERIDAYDARLAEPGFRPRFGPSDFDAAIQSIVDDLSAALPDAETPVQPRARGVRAVRLTLGSREAPRTRQAPRRPAPRVPAGALDEAWPRLRNAMPLWRPVSDNHLAPVVLFADPLLRQLITPDRGRALLAVPRG